MCYMRERMNKRPETRKIDRRTFLKGTATGLGMLALSDLQAHAQAAQPPETWDETFDVVVVGSGAAGAMAALRAHEQGASVLLLEKQSFSNWGGSTAISGGIFWVPNNRYMAEEGISDSREEALTYLRLTAQGQADDDLIIAYADHCNEMLEFLEEQTNLEFQLYRRGTRPFPDYHPEWPGGKPGGRGVYAKPYKGYSYGRALMEGLRDALNDRGIPSWFRSPVQRLIVDEQGVVIGVQGEKLGQPLSVRARKGVILACGGFEWNPTLVRHFLRGPSPITNTPPQGNTGDGLLMALSVGADLRNMNQAWGVPMYQVPDQETGLADWFQWRGKPGAIMVNRYGRRFCNESADYSTTWRSFFAWENWGDTGYANIPAFTIVDQSMVERYGFLTNSAGKSSGVGKIPTWVTQGGSLRELAEKLSIDPEGLEHTVAEFNKYAGASPPQDPDFHRGESLVDQIAAGDHSREGTAACLGPLELPPFYGASIWPGICGTCGGPRVNMWAQVLRHSGEPIAGLYAAGNVAGIGGPGVLEAGGGGGTIGPALTFGFLAGTHTANRMVRDHT